MFDILAARCGGRRARGKRGLNQGHGGVVSNGKKSVIIAGNKHPSSIKIEAVSGQEGRLERDAAAGLYGIDEEVDDFSSGGRR